MLPRQIWKKPWPVLIPKRNKRRHGQFMTRRQRPIFLPYRKLQGRRPKPQGILKPRAVAPSSGEGKAAPGQDWPETVPAATGQGSPAEASPEATAAPPSETETTASVFPVTPKVINLSGPVYDFGEVVVGAWAEWALTLRNEGDGEGIICEIVGLPSEGFSLMNLPVLPFVIPPHESRVITVRYTPWQADESVARLSITTNNHDLPVQIVFLIGRGRAAH